MSAESKKLIEEIEKLDEQQQAAVKQFIAYLKSAKTSPFLSAVDDFIDKHPELLRRLAQ
ncbi:MAG TPA: hypothetical protein VGK99_07095 [Acidobacteriota bacterium]|jgi:hypothetical protein